MSVHGKRTVSESFDRSLRAVPAAGGFFDSSDTRIEPSKIERRNRPMLTVLAGHDVGALFGVAAEARLGRSAQCQVRIDHPSVSRYHARIRRDRGNVYVLEDNHSRNGTTVGGRRITACLLKDGDRIGLGQQICLRFAWVTRTEEESARRLYQSAMLDCLTQAVNRRHFEQRMTAEVAFANRHDTPLALLLIDLDCFKRINDSRGHLVGDRVLQQLASTVRGALRAEDVFARYGGEEFAIIARGLDVQHAMLLAERVRALVEKTTFDAGALPMPVTVSIGVSSRRCCRSPAGVQDLIETADRRLYLAKSAGRNRCVGSDPD